jgi:DNA-binding PadR family transcriptional regulator
MPLGEVLLGVLVDGPAHGYDLKRAHDERFPASRTLAYGQVYATLARIERADLVEILETRQGNGPERTVYSLTDAGAVRLRSWLEATEEPGAYAADELVRKTVVALHAGHDASDFLARQREVHLSAMRRLTLELREAESPAAQIAIDHALAHLDAELRWLEDARARVLKARSQRRREPRPAGESTNGEPGHAEAG